MNDKRKMLVKIPVEDLKEVSYMSDTLILHFNDMDAFNEFVNQVLILKMTLGFKED